MVKILDNESKKIYYQNKEIEFGYIKNQLVFGNNADDGNKELTIVKTLNTQICTGVGACSGSYTISDFSSGDVDFPTLKDLKKITVDVTFYMNMPVLWKSAIVNGVEYGNEQTDTFTVTHELVNTDIVSVSATYDRRTGALPQASIKLATYTIVGIYSK